MTNQQGAPEAPRGTAADGKTELFNVPGYPLMVRAVDFNRLHAENERLAALVEAPQPAPSAASKAVLAAIRAANMQLVRTGDDEFMLVTYKNAKAQCDGGQCGIGGYCDDCPTPQADSQPAPVREEEREAFKAAHRHLELDEVPDAWGRPTFKHSHVEASWLGWIARAARATADSVTAPAGGWHPFPHYLQNPDGRLLRTSADLLERHGYTGCSTPLRRMADALLNEPAAPTQAADSVLEDAGGANWQDISTAPKDGTRFVAVGNNYGLYSEPQHTCIAQWFRGCWMDVSEWNETSELKYLTHWMPLLPLPGTAARKQGGAA